VPVSLELAAYPFPRPPFEDAGSPREMAELMRKQPKPAVALLESGEVRRWFEANGWTYPVSGPTAPGVAAVQQFFEGMGLSKPPPLQLSEDEVHFTCVQPEVVRGKVALRAGSKKWVYAYSDSDASWLKVTTPIVSGSGGVVPDLARVASGGPAVGGALHPPLRAFDLVARQYRGPHSALAPAQPLVRHLVRRHRRRRGGDLRQRLAGLSVGPDRQ